MSQSDSMLIRSLQSFVDEIPFAKAIGIKVTAAQKGFVETHVYPSKHLFSHFGTYQAGVYFTLAEVTGGLLCGTFLDLTGNLLITKKSEIKFDNSVGDSLISSATLPPSSIEKLLSELDARKKSNILVDVFINSLSGKPIAKCHNEYYLRIGIPKSFTSGRRIVRSKSVI